MRKVMNLVLGNTLIVVMGIMVLNVIWQVASRYILGAPSSFTDELSRYLMIWVGVLGAAYVSGKRMHVAIDILPSKLSARSRKKMEIAVTIIIMTFALGALVIGGSRLVYISYLLGQRSPALQIPLMWVYLALPVSGILIIIYKTLDLLKK